MDTKENNKTKPTSSFLLLVAMPLLLVASCYKLFFFLPGRFLARPSQVLMNDPAHAAGQDMSVLNLGNQAGCFSALNCVSCVCLLVILVVRGCDVTRKQNRPSSKK